MPTDGQDLHAAILPPNLPSEMVPHLVFRHNGRLRLLRHRLPPGLRLAMSTHLFRLDELARRDDRSMQRHQRPGLDFRCDQRSA